MSKNPTMPTARRLALLLALLTICHTAFAQVNSPPREFARALLLIPSKTVWIYGGMTTFNATRSQWNVLTELDVSVPWLTDNPPYTDHTQDSSGVSPDTIYGTLFPTGNQQGFFSFDAYGVNNNYGFAEYNVITHLWTTYPTAGVVLPNAGPAAYDTSGNAWVWGGISISGTYDPNDVFRWDPVSQLWSRSSPPVPITQRTWHTANLLPTGVIIIIGGMNQIYNGTAWNNFWASMNATPCYDTSSGVWHENTALGSIPQSRNLHTTVLAQDGYSLIVYGGTAPAAVNGVIPSLRPSSGSSEITLGDIQVLDTRTYTWIAISTHGVAPNPRFGHTAVQVGGLMIVMGGSTGQNYSANLVNDTLVMDTTQWFWLTAYTPPTNWTSPFPTTTSSISTPTSTSTSSAVLNSTASPLVSSSSPPAGLGTGAIAAISVSAVAILAAAGVFLFMRYNRPSRAETVPNPRYLPRDQGPPQHDSGQIYDAFPQSARPYSMQSPPLPPPHQNTYRYPQTGYSYTTDGQGYPTAAASSAASLPPKHIEVDTSPNEYAHSVPPPWRPAKMDQDQTKVGVITLDLSKPDDTVEEYSDVQYRY